MLNFSFFFFKVSFKAAFGEIFLQYFKIIVFYVLKWSVLKVLHLFDIEILCNILNELHS